VKWLIILLLAVVVLLVPLWLLRAADDGLTQNGLRTFTICGKARASEGADPMSSSLAMRVMDATPGSRVGTWSVKRGADCDVFIHYSRDLD
jgi:hypothetical protein